MERFEGVILRDKFGHRHKTLTADGDVRALSLNLKLGLKDPSDRHLRAAVDDIHPADLADAMRYLSDAEDLALFQRLTHVEAAEVLDEVDETTLKKLVRSTAPDILASILQHLPADEAADIISVLPSDQWELVLSRIREPEPLRTLLAYQPETAGGLMARGYVDVPLHATQQEAVEQFRTASNLEHIFYIYAFAVDGQLAGAVDLHTLLRAEPTALIADLIDKEVVRVPPEMDQEQVASIFNRYDLSALPVVDPANRMLGVITSDHIIDVVIQEAGEDVGHMSGTDAHELEMKSPTQIAMMRMPWILTTMFIELIAGFVVKKFDHTLAQVLLLASFMPIISAISGNTGLQSAAIIIRGLSTGHVQISDWKHAVKRQMATTVLIAAVCAICLGVIGALWYGKWTFGALVSVGMFASINIAGAVGTTIPLLSKKLGFDPALTAGPFETAFQDVIGISIFLGMATVLMPYLK